LTAGSLISTPVDEAIRGMRIPVGSASETCDTFSYALLTKVPILIHNYDNLAALPNEFLHQFQPALPLVLIPLKIRDEAIGLLIADNKFTRASVTDDDVESLSTLANTAASAIEKTQLLSQIG
jgi:GAF domain-containing protein